MTRSLFYSKIIPLIYSNKSLNYHLIFYSKSFLYMKQMDLSSNKSITNISIFDDYLQYNNAIIKGYLYNEILLILQSGKIPSELINILPTSLEIIDHRYHQRYEVELEASLHANFDIMESNSTSRFDMFNKESELLKSLPIDFEASFSKRSFDYFLKNKFNIPNKRYKPEVYLEDSEPVLLDANQQSINMDLFNDRMDVSFITKLNQVRHVVSERNKIKIETITENQVKSLNGFVIVQSIKFKHNFLESYVTINLLSSQKEEYFIAAIYFGSIPDTTYTGFSIQMPVGLKNAIPIVFENLINRFKIDHLMTFDSKLNIATPPRLTTPEVEDVSNSEIFQLQKQRMYTQQPQSSPNVMFSPNYRQMQYRPQYQQQTPQMQNVVTAASPLINGQMYRPMNSQGQFNYQMYHQMQQQMQQQIQQQMQQQMQVPQMYRVPHPQMMYRMNRPGAYRQGIVLPTMQQQRPFTPPQQQRPQYVQRPAPQ
eukprot:NODE_450_length_8384_cov_0.353530.p1 type:complete len:482 gc:universal NODE_450_length_8384_cov_0.353530:5514-6959(+)